MTISIHALHEESEPQFISSGTYIIISIHALHEESEACITLIAYDRIISIHALHEESDWRCLKFVGGLLFQSTLSMRRATVMMDAKRRLGYFNPRSP